MRRRFALTAAGSSPTENETLSDSPAPGGGSVAALMGALGVSLGGMVAQKVALERPSLVRRMLLVGTAPAGGEDIMHLEKPELSKILGDPGLSGYQVLVKLFFSPSESSQAAGPSATPRRSSAAGEPAKQLTTGIVASPGPVAVQHQ